MWQIFTEDQSSEITDQVPVLDGQHTIKLSLLYFTYQNGCLRQLMASVVIISAHCGGED